MSIDIDDLHVEPDGLVIVLHNEKTARDSEPVIAATPHSASHNFSLPCTFAQLVRTMAEIGLTSGPLFRRIDRWGHIGSDRLTPKAVTLILRQGLRKADAEEPQLYSSHSLRHGVVAAAVDQGYSDREIMLLTMHRSLAGLRAHTLSRNPWRDSPKRLPLYETIPESTSEQNGWLHEP